MLERDPAMVDYFESFANVVLGAEEACKNSRTNTKVYAILFWALLKL